MADQRITYQEKMVGANHPTLPDTLNRMTLIEHATDGTHKFITDTTQSTSTSTGAIITAGGLGVAKNAHIGGDLTVTGHATLEGVTPTGATGSGKLVFDTIPTIASPTLSGHVTIEGVTTTGATGTGNVVFSTSPTLTSPSLGVATGTSFNSITGLSATTPSMDGSASVGTATTTARADHVHPSDTAKADKSGNLSQFASTTSAQLAGVISDETGSGALVFANTPTLVAPVLGTPNSGTLTNCTGLPISTGVSGLGANVGAFLGTPTSANLAAAITGETGTGALVFANSPNLVTPNIGVASGTSFNSITALSSTLPSMDSVAAIGTSTTVARADHTHPSDTTKAAAATTISTSAPLSGGGDLSTNRTLSISQATTSTNGYLSSTDWNTFNGKASTSGTLAQFAATTSSQLAGVISDETGSGSLVFNTSPTLSGVTLSDGTANGVLYLNGSKQVTSGSALVFDGTNLGIGTASPVAKLDVFASGSNTRFNSADSNAPYITFSGNGTPKYYIGSAYHLLTGGAAADLALTSGGKVIIASGGVTTPAMTLNSSGNLGIGTSSPQYKGHFYTGAASGYGVQIGGSSGVAGNYTGVLFSSADGAGSVPAYNGAIRLQITASSPSYQDPDMVFMVQDRSTYMLADMTEKMRLTGSGNLGIGTASPTNTLSVSGNANITGNTTLGDASTDTVTVNGYVGVGGAPTSSAVAFTVSNVALTGTNQYGISGQITGTSAATQRVVAVDSYPQTANAAFTTTDVIGYYARSGLKGASNTATNWHGVYIADQTQGTNNYGITSAVSSGTNKWNIYSSGTANNYFAGNVGIGATVFSTSDWFSSVPKQVISSTSNLGLRMHTATAGSGVGIAGISFAGNDASANQKDVAVIRGETAAANADAGVVQFLTRPSGGSLTERFEIGVTEAVFNDPGNDYDFRVESDTNTHALFVDAGNSRVGINNSSPTVALDITGDLKTSGNLGIGTSSPSYKLDISGSGVTGARFTSSGTDSLLRLTNTGSGGHDWYMSSVYSVGSLIFVDGTAGSERMRLDSSGNLMVGTTTAYTTGLNVAANGLQVAFRHNSATAGLYWSAGSDSQNYFYIQNQSGNGVYLTPSGSSWNSLSDEREKDILEPIANASEKVSSLRAVIGKYKTDEEGTRRSFLIAQDVQAVLPEAVDTANPDRLGLAYTDVIPLLVAAIKELKMTNESQSQTIESLTQRIEALEAKGE